MRTERIRVVVTRESPHVNHHTHKRIQRSSFQHLTAFEQTDIVAFVEARTTALGATRKRTNMFGAFASVSRITSVLVVLIALVAGAASSSPAPPTTAQLVSPHIAKTVSTFSHATSAHATRTSSNYLRAAGSIGSASTWGDSSSNFSSSNNNNKTISNIIDDHERSIVQSLEATDRVPAAAHVQSTTALICFVVIAVLSSLSGVTAIVVFTRDKTHGPQQQQAVDLVTVASTASNDNDSSYARYFESTHCVNSATLALSPALSMQNALRGTHDNVVAASMSTNTESIAMLTASFYIDDDVDDVDKVLSSSYRTCSHVYAERLSSECSSTTATGSSRSLHVDVAAASLVQTRHDPENYATRPIDTRRALQQQFYQQQQQQQRQRSISEGSAFSIDVEDSDNEETFAALQQRYARTDTIDSTTSELFSTFAESSRSPSASLSWPLDASWSGSDVSSLDSPRNSNDGSLSDDRSSSSSSACSPTSNSDVDVVDVETVA